MSTLAGFDLPADEELTARARKFCGDGDRLLTLIVVSEGENTYYALAHFVRTHPTVEGAKIAKERYLAFHADGDDKMVPQNNAGINRRVTDMGALAQAQRQAWTRYSAVDKYGDDGDTLVLNLVTEGENDA